MGVMRMSEKPYLEVDPELASSMDSFIGGSAYRSAVFPAMN